MTLWFYVVDPAGRFRSISLRAWKAFHEGDMLLPPSRPGFVRFAEVLVEHTNRKPVAVRHVAFHEMPLDRNGKADRMRVARAAVASLDHCPRESFLWAPSNRQLAELYGLINRRAKNVLLRGAQRFRVYEGGRRPKA